MVQAFDAFFSARQPKIEEEIEEDGEETVDDGNADEGEAMDIADHNEGHAENSSPDDVDDFNEIYVDLS